MANATLGSGKAMAGVKANNNLMQSVATLLGDTSKTSDAVAPALLELWLQLAERQYRTRHQLEALALKMKELNDEKEVVHLDSLRADLQKVMGKENTLRSLSKHLSARTGAIEGKYRGVVAEETQKQQKLLEDHRKRVDEIQARIQAHGIKADAVEVEKDTLQKEITEVLALIKTQDEEQATLEATSAAADTGQQEVGNLDLDADGNVKVSLRDRERYAMAQAEYKTRMHLIRTEDAGLQQELIRCQKRVGEVAGKISAIHDEFGSISAAIACLDEKVKGYSEDNKECERRMVTLGGGLAERDALLQSTRLELENAHSLGNKYDTLMAGLIKAISEAENAAASD